MSRIVVIADDEKNTREGLRWALEGHADEIVLAADGEEVIDILSSRHVDLVISDLKMPKLDGMGLLQQLKQDFPDTGFIMLTGHGTVETAVDAMKQGAFDYLIKPVNIDELGMLVDRLFSTRSLVQENERLRAEVNERYGFESIVGNSAQMLELFDKIRQVAPTRASVLITGPTGTGKELVAKAIHFNSPRKNKPFIAVNCGALSASLLESELFGHERGAFTGAVKQRAGRFEAAHQGTIFLDEIGEISPDFQVKLLRVLQEQEFERVGGGKPVKVDVRVLVATNRDLKAEVAAGRFREDLFYRLNVIRLDIPALRERPDDIPLIVNFYLKKFNAENNKSLVMTPKAMALMQSYSWPGNVRQLRMMIESIVILTPGKEIQPKHLPEEVRHDTSPGQQVRLRVGMTVEECERELIRATLASVDGNKARASRMLGLGRKTLYRKLEEYGMEEGGEKSEE